MAKPSLSKRTARSAVPIDDEIVQIPKIVQDYYRLRTSFKEMSSLEQRVKLELLKVGRVHSVSLARTTYPLEYYTLVIRIDKPSRPWATRLINRINRIMQAHQVNPLVYQILPL